MTTRKYTEQGHDALNHFLGRNQGRDLRSIDFHNRQQLSALDWEGVDREAATPHLKAYQRLMQVSPDAEVNRALMERGLDSAHKIAAMPERKFLREHGPLFEDEEEARRVHQKAKSVRARARHLWANVNDMVASAHYRSALFQNVDPALVEYFQSIPSYQDLFGGTDYCQCGHCRSILSPAAYFLDIMRIADQYITEPNTGTPGSGIPPGFTLEERRPDLFDLKLNCANTDTPVAYLYVVNRILQYRIEADSPRTPGSGTISFRKDGKGVDGVGTKFLSELSVGDQIQCAEQYRTIAEIASDIKLSVDAVWTADAAGAPYTVSDNGFKTLAVSGYPFNLPFNLPLEQIRLYLQELKTTLASVYETFLVPQPDLPGVKPLDVAREYLNFSIEEYGVVTRPDASAQSLSRYYGYADILKHLPFAGAGALTFNKDGRSTGGTGTRFRAELSVGDQIRCADNTRTVTNLGTGKLIFKKNDRAVAGNLTRFLAELSAGDKIQCRGVVRTVESVSSDTELKVVEPWDSDSFGTDYLIFYAAPDTRLLVDHPWGVGAADAAYTISPLDALDHVKTFLRRTGIDRDQLDELFTQQLDQAELRAGLADNFFINKTDEGLPYLQTYFDRSDPENPYTKIKGLSLKRLDRLNRFIRLAANLGWSYADLDWGMVSIQSAEITEATVRGLAKIKKLQTSTKLPVDVLCSFWHDMKTTGRVSASDPQDLFDRVFNNPKLLNGRNPYSVNLPPVPFDPARPLDWVVEDRSGENLTIRTRLLAALLVNDNDLTTLANYVLAAAGLGGPTLRLDLQNLTRLYRLTKLPALFGFSVDEYLTLLHLVFYPDRSNHLEPPAVLPSSVDDVLKIQEAAAWLLASPFNVYEVRYIMTGVANDYVNRGYTEDGIKPFIRNLSTISAGSRVARNGFVFENITADDSEVIFQRLRDKGFISDIGLMLSGPVGYRQLAFLFPVLKDSFVAEDVITDEQSEQAYGKLLAAHILEPQDPPTSATLSESYTPATPLDFLFTSTGEGQTRTVESYDAGTKVATVREPWETTPDATSYYLIKGTAAAGRARGGGATTVRLAETASALDGAYAGMQVAIVGGTGGGQGRTVVSYEGASREAAVDTGWAVQPDDTSEYAVTLVREGTARGGGASTITLAGDASGVENIYKGMEVKIIADPRAELQRATVKETLVRVRRDINHTAEVLGESASLQNQNALGGLAQFLSTTTEMLSVLLPFASHLLSLSDYIEALLAPVPEINPTVFSPAVTPGSFVTGDIDSGASAAVFNILKDPAHQIIVDLNAGQTSGSVSPTFNQTTDLSFLFADDAEAARKREEVRSILLLSQRAQKVFSLVAVLSRVLLLANSLHLTPQESSAVVTKPAAFGIKDTARLTFADIQSLSLFKYLVLDLRDQDGLLVQYLLTSDAPASFDKKMALLARLLGWNVNQVLTLVNLFWPQGDHAGEYNYNTVVGVARLKRGFDLSAQMGVDVYFLLKLCALSETAAAGRARGGGATTVRLAETASALDGAYAGMQVAIVGGTGGGQGRTVVSYEGASREAAVDTGWAVQPDDTSVYRVTGLALSNTQGHIIDANWNLYQRLASSTLSAINAKYEDPEFNQLYTSLAGQIDTLERDALLGFCVWSLNKRYPFIEKPSDLYQFLLIDVEMSGCASTSFIVQAIASVQLYMQRCRMSLEQGVTRIEIPDVWWEWMSSYRVWEANRKIFLYPENYAEPTLRKNQTPLFRSFTDELLQSNITDATVTDAFVHYFDDFAAVANLVPCASYNTTTLLPATAQDAERPVDTMYLFGRTSAEPYTYYFRTFEDRHAGERPTSWTPWEKIKLNIVAPKITPVRAFGRLFIFWSELEVVKSSAVENNRSEPQSVTRATLKYSFYTSSKEWIQPQVLVKDLVVSVHKPDYDPIRKPQTETLFDPHSLYWQMPYILNVAGGLPGSGRLNIVEGLANASGEGTQFERQLNVGDRVWCAGELRKVLKVDKRKQQLLVDKVWTVDATKAEYKIFPQETPPFKDPSEYEPFEGSGTIVFVEGLSNVKGLNTDFSFELTEGDQIQSEGQTRTVVKIFVDSQQLRVDEPWGADSDAGKYTVIPKRIDANTNQDGFLPFKGLGKIDLTKELANVRGTNTKFTVETALGDQIQCAGETGTIIKIVNDTDLLMDRKWTVEATGADYVIVPRAKGSEQLLVVYGAKLDVNAQYDLALQLPITPNPGQDTFIENRNEFNRSLYRSLLLAQKAKDNSLGGYVSLGQSVLLNQDLFMEETHMVSLDYLIGATDNPQPYEPVLDRNNSVLKVALSRNVVVDNYWGNSAPGGGDGAGPAAPGGRDLLYHVAGTQSSLYNVANQPGWFIFDNGDESFLVVSQEPKLGKISEFAFLRPLPTSQEPNDLRVSCGAYTTRPEPFDRLKFRFIRLSTNAVAPLRRRLMGGGIDRLLSLDSQELLELPFNRFYQKPDNVPPPAMDENALPPARIDFDGSYGEYFWEIFFYAPFLVAEHLNANMRFAKASAWYEYIFNPTQQPDGTEVQPNDRYWRFRELRNLTPESLASVLSDQEQIDIYNNDPFDPNAIARLRLTAYQKCVVMKYIDNLLDWGDSLFAQDTRESITQATNLYVMAADLLGERPQAVGECPAPAPMSFNEIKAEYPEGIPEFLIELENSSLLLAAGDRLYFTDVPFNDINSYFCVPENEEFVSYWDRVEDRLFKIRHCMNIQGVERPLALFEPPINPRELIRAAMSGGEEAGLIPRIEPSVPNYRFSYVLGVAKGLTSDLMQLGSALLAALEKKDAEDLTLLRTSQEKAILNLTTRIKQLQIEQTIRTQESLVESQNNAKERLAYYTQLTTKGLSPGELLNLQAMQVALLFNTLASVTRTAASIGYAVPNVGSPFAMTYGGQQIGSMLTAASGVFELGGFIASFIADRSLTMSNYERRAEDWELQAKLADSDSKQIAAQIAANALQLKMAERELEIHNKMIQQTDEVESFYKNKFTNRELYQWMVGRVSIAYFQTYSLCFELARSAERAYQYELNSDKTFVNFGYWDNLRKGLLAGEGLMLALNQMEKARLDGNVRALEIEKTVSLMQLQPKALLDLKTKGECMFELTEKLFDYDFPGHYARRIKSVSISIPTVLGPYQNIKATLTQLSNQIVLQKNAAAVDAVDFLLGGRTATAPGPGVLRTNWLASQQIAISRGANDSGVFELNFGDDRYLPFEGTGAVSTWRLTMPFATNQIDFSAISDVVIQLQYTAFDGGAEFRRRVTGLASLKPFVGSRFLSLAQQYSQQWYAFMHDHSDTARQTLRFDLAAFTPAHLQGAKLLGFYLKLEVAPGTDTGSATPYIKFQVTGDTSVAFAPGPNNDYSYTFPSRPAATKAVGGRALGFELARTPNGLKIGRRPDGFLDPEVLRNIVLILYYEGEVDWSFNT